MQLNVNNPRAASRDGLLKNRKPIDQRKTDDYDDELNSFLPNESLPNIEDVLENTTVNNSFLFNQSIETGDRVFKQKRPKNRPSLMDYYGNISLDSSRSSQHRNGSHHQGDHDIDETFDFLDEELNKYK